VDTAIKILMAVVIGALLLAGLYALFGEQVLPILKQRIIDMFNYGK
jgi:lipopolysaccharide export LptBFGC system permease protein LptF